MAVLVAGLFLVPCEGSADQPLIVGIDHAFPPYQYVDELGSPAGFDVDLFRAVAEAAGIDYQIQSGPWEEIRRRLEAGEIDVSPGMVETEMRDLRLDFSVPTVFVHHSIFVRKDSGIREPSQLLGAVISVERAAVWEDRIRERGIDVRIDAAETPAGALRRVADGRAKGAILLLDQGLFLIRDRGLVGIQSLGKATDTSAFRFAVPEGRADFLEQLNDGLSAVRASGRYDELYDQWFGVLRDVPLWERGEVRALLALTAVAVLLLAAVSLWSHALRRRVAERTSELAAAEAERLRLHDQLVRSQKMEALGRLAGGVAHDFDNVLTTIVGNAGLALEKADADGPVARALNAIHRAGQAGANLTRQLLSFSRGESSEPRNVRWNDVIGDAQEMLQRLIGSRINVRVDTQDGLWPVRLDPGQALQIVMNLVINARDAIPGAGNITIETANAPREGRELVRLTVRDDGEGMDAATRERIFEPFFTRKESGKGTGLGLSTVYGIVQSCRGSIEVESEPAAGSSFEILLPRAPEPEPSEARPPVPASGEAGTILLVEDDPGVREVAGILLRASGYEVVEAADGESALAIVREKSDIGILVTDLQLPRLSGPDLARAVLDETPGMGVIFLSGYPGSLELPRGARIRFVPKPFTPESLADALESLLGSEQ